ncbi:MAG: triose-phosphate isomerase, partial [Planctomycetota bacterium]
DLLVCPPSVYLAPVGEALSGKPVALGAQNMCCQDNGAFTGEISHSMLTDIGAEYVILGHSERRTIFGETDTNVNDKTKKAIEAGLAPIVCVGELLEEREADKTAEVVKTQIEGALAGIPEDKISGVVIAYEPVWAIGTGKVATPEQAEEVHAQIRSLLASLYSQAGADGVQILYGGSMKPGNAPELLSQPNVDGGLIGGASLKADDFLAIAAAAPAAG